MIRIPACPCFELAADVRNIQIDEYAFKACSEFQKSLDEMHLCDDATMFVIGALLTGYCVGHMTQILGSGWSDRITPEYQEHLERFIDDAAQHAKERTRDFLQHRTKRNN